VVLAVLYIGKHLLQEQAQAMDLAQQKLLQLQELGGLDHFLAVLGGVQEPLLQSQ
jgi:hypothetical protein